MRKTLLILACTVAFSACGGSNGNRSTDGAADSHISSGGDAGDAGADAAARRDTAGVMDVSASDAGTDTNAPETAVNGEAGAAAEAGADTSTDSPADGNADVGADAPADTGPDAGPGAEVGAGSDAGSDTADGSADGSVDGPPAPGLPTGAVCSVGGDCLSGLCKPAVPGLAAPVCVKPCAQQSDCSQGTDFFCDPIVPGSTDGYCVPHSPAHCAACAVDSDCGSLSESCFLAPGDVAKACHVDCSLSGQSACPSDYTCTDQTVGGQARQLCRPASVATCLDAAGGYCDRVTAPEPCARDNSAGTCTGARACLPTSGRFDVCSAPAPQCKTDCSIQDPSGCTEQFCPSATTGVTNCGTCGIVCPGYLQTSSNVTCQNGATCTFSCQGENYNVSAAPQDGCSVTDAPTGNHTQTTAVSLGSLSCNDASSNPNISGKLPSDARVHENPSIVGFDAASGSAPDWYSITATGGLTCTDDLSLTLQVSGSSQPSCYKLTVITNVGTYSAQSNTSGTATITQGSGAYNDNTTIYVEVQKTCGTNVTENATYTVTGHL